MTQLPDLNRNLLLFDGAMGTMVQKYNILEPGEAPEILNLTHPELIAAIHQQYRAAGSQCIETNTFGASRIKLSAAGLDGKVTEINAAAVRIAKTAAQAGGWVAASIGPTGQMIEPLGDLSFEDAYAAFQEQVRACAAAGADLINIETMSDIQEAKAAILAALEVNLPVIASMSFMENGRLLTGLTPEMVAAILSGYPLYALGTNCGLPATALLPIVQKLAAYSSKPLIVQPNAGKPSLDNNGVTVYQESAAEFGAVGRELIRSGARVIGGCCGTSPDHIRELSRGCSAIQPYELPVIERHDYLVSKNGCVPAAPELDSAAVYPLELHPEAELWRQFQNDGEDALIDLLFEIDPQIKALRIRAAELTVQDKSVFRSFLQILAAYWPNLLQAELSDPELIKVFLAQIPGRSLVIGKADPGLRDLTESYGGLYQVIR